MPTGQIVLLELGMSIHLHIVCSYFVLWWQSWAVRDILPKA